MNIFSPRTVNTLILLALLAGLLVGVLFEPIPFIAAALHSLSLPLYSLALAALMALLLGAQPRVLVLCSAALLGVVYAWNSAEQHKQHMLNLEMQGELIEISGFVVGLPKTEIRYGKPVQRFDLLVSAERWPLSERGLRKVRLSWFGGPTVKAGQAWVLRGKLRRPRGLANPSGFDYQLALHRQGIDATGSIRWGERYSARSEPIRAYLARWRGRVSQDLEDQFGAMAGYRFVRALTLGDGSSLGADDWQVLQRTGTTHLFVISGLHISLLAGLAYYLCLPLCRMLSGFTTLPSHYLAAPFMMGAAGAYAALAGFTLPTQRALLMLAAALLYRLLAQRARSSSVLLFAALAVLLVEPFEVLSAGFYLSFGAVAALLFAFSHRLKGTPRSVQLFKTQWVCFVALLAPLLIWFQTTTLMMPLVNLVMVPLLTFALVPIALVLLSLSIAGIAIGPEAIDLISGFYTTTWSLLEFVSLNADWAFIKPNVYAGAIAVLSVVLLLPKAARRPLMLPCAIICLCLPGKQQGSSAQCAPAEVTFYDVGQGLAVSIEYKSKLLVYDLGPRFSQSNDAGKSIIGPDLRAKGWKQIDLLVLSHLDMDHAGGLQGVREWLDIRRILGSEKPDGPEPFERCEASTQWRWGELQFDFVHSAQQGRESLSRNNASCVLRVSSSYASMLLTGDIEMAAERSLIAGDIQSDLVSVPHHGSKTSSTREFIRAVDPQWAIASAGFMHRFGHPHSKVVERYKEQGVTLMNTADSGAVSWELPVCSDMRSKPQAYREQDRNYWLRW